MNDAGVPWDCRREASPERKIALVRDDDGRPALHGLQQLALFLVQRLRGVQDNQDDGGIGESFAAAGDAKLLGFFDSLAQAGGVD